MTFTTVTPKVPACDPIKAEPSLLTTELEVILTVANTAIAANEETHPAALAEMADRLRRLPERGLPLTSKALLQRARRTITTKARKALQAQV